MLLEKYFLNHVYINGPIFQSVIRKAVSKVPVPGSQKIIVPVPRPRPRPGPGLRLERIKNHSTGTGTVVVICSSTGTVDTAYKKRYFT